MLKALDSSGYRIKNSPIGKLSLAYADDLSLVTSNVKGNQEALDKTDTFLQWTATMKAKPKKCVSFAARQFSSRNVTKLPFEKYQETIYSPFNPLLTIAGEKTNFMVTRCTRCTRVSCVRGTCCSCSSCHSVPDPNSIAHNHFKFLGRRIGISLDEFKTDHFVRNKFRADIDLTNKTDSMV